MRSPSALRETVRSLINFKAGINNSRLALKRVKTCDCGLPRAGLSVRSRTECPIISNRFFLPEDILRLNSELTAVPGYTVIFTHRRSGSEYDHHV